MNLVLHPSLAERYVQQTSRPCNNNKRRRISKSGQPPHPTSDPDSPPTDLVYPGPAPAWCYLCTPFSQQQTPQSFDGEPWKFYPNSSEGSEWTSDVYSNPNPPPDTSSSPPENAHCEPSTPTPTSPSIAKKKRSLSAPLIPPLPDTPTRVPSSVRCPLTLPASWMRTASQEYFSSSRICPFALRVHFACVCG